MIPPCTDEAPPPTGLEFTPHFSEGYIDDPMTAVQWEWADVPVPGRDETRNLEFPVEWSMKARIVVADRYFRVGRDGPETSFRQVVGRVADAIVTAGIEHGYYATSFSAMVHRAEIIVLILTQRMSFNSPVWFNVGIDEKPQVSACHIVPIEDDMESILQHYVVEGRIYKRGSGSGTNYSRLRGSNERISSGGTSSGPLAFIRGHDAAGGSIKSGGATRRAAKMVVLDADHPDAPAFVVVKSGAERAAHALVAAGWSPDFTDEQGAYAAVHDQNANHSLRVTDEFMRQATDDDDSPRWALTNRLDGSVYEMVSAREMLWVAAESAWTCGDPGLQYDDAIQKMHTTPSAGRIDASNPCAEFVYLDNTSCNLASLNLVPFFSDGPAGYDTGVRDFIRAVRCTVVAMDALVSMGSYPTEEIAEMTRATRPLGLGFTNAGALVMRHGLPYDSAEARTLVAAISSLMAAAAWRTSVEIAGELGSYDLYDANRASVWTVVDTHVDAAVRVRHPIGESAMVIWREVCEEIFESGLRNGQLTVIAPTGTISFMMDADTFGIEPAAALVTQKRLVGGGTIATTTSSVGPALRRLRYDDTTVKTVVHHLERTGTLHLDAIAERHHAVLATAFPGSGVAAIHWSGHLAMMAAVQPFLSGAISKTVSLPADATVQDVFDVYTASWRLGLKAVAVYRDGCKASQPLEVVSDRSDDEPAVESERILFRVQDSDTVAIETVNDMTVFEKPDGSVRIAAPPSWTPPTGFVRVVGPRNQDTGADDIVDRLRADQGTPIEQKGIRRRLPKICRSLRKKFSIGGHDGYLHVGLYDDGSPGEIFVRMAKEGSVVSGFVDAWATAVSIAIQYGAPLDVLADKFVGAQFEPAGWTGEADIPMASSVVDYIFRWMSGRFGPDGGSADGEPETAATREDEHVASTSVAPVEPTELAPTATGRTSGFGPLCTRCGSLTERDGKCWVCPSCGGGSGCGG